MIRIAVSALDTDNDLHPRQLAALPPRRFAKSRHPTPFVSFMLSCLPQPFFPARSEIAILVHYRIGRRERWGVNWTLSGQLRFERPEAMYHPSSPRPRRAKRDRGIQLDTAVGRHGTSLDPFARSRSPNSYLPTPFPPPQPTCEDAVPVRLQTLVLIPHARRRHQPRSASNRANAASASRKPPSQADTVKPNPAPTS